MALITAGATIIAALLTSTLPTLLKSIEEKIKNREGLEVQVRSLESQMKHIKAAIMDHRERQSDMTHLEKTYIQGLKCLAYDMEDCVETFKVAKTVKLQKITELKNTLKDTNKLCNVLKNMYEEVREQQAQNGASSSTRRVQTSSYQPRQQDLSIPLVDLVGKRENLRELLDLMRTSSESKPEEMRLKVILISIVGFSGIGRTLLAKQVYNTVLRQNQFSRYVFIDAASSQEIKKDKDKILEEIIQKIIMEQGIQQDGMGTSASSQAYHQAKRRVGDDPSSSNQDPQNTIQERLRDCLGQNRYFIVIDDVGSEELGSYITSAFPENEQGSRVIITMTVPGSAESCRSGHVCKKRPLRAEESVNSFLNEALRGRQQQIVVEEAVSPSTIQKICDGVPLALLSISEVRQGHLNPFKVEQAWTNLRKKEEDRWAENMELVLGYCYDSLCEKDIKDSLLYFSMFPRGHHVKRGSLIRRWEAEGPEIGASTTQQAAEKFRRIMDLNFIWPLQASMNEDQHIKTCQSPAVMLDYITRKSESENFIMFSCGDDQTGDVHRLSLHTSASANEERIMRNKGMSRLRTLAVFRSNKKTEAMSFKNCEMLRVLDLEACNDLSASHLDEICKYLKLLKYLSLRAASITKVPSDIAELKLLQTLDLGKRTLVTLPIDVLKLPNLKHLLGKYVLCKGHSSNKKLIKFLSGKSKSGNSELETLAGFVVWKEKGFPQLMRHMVELRKVKIWFSTDAYARSTAADLNEGFSKFCDNASGDATDGSVGRGSLKIDLEHCSPDLLDSLDMAGCKLFYLKVNCRDVTTRLPAFVANLGVITKLYLSWTTLEGNEILGKLSNLESLKYLKLVADDIEGSFDGAVGEIQRQVIIKSDHKWESLERLCIVARRRMDKITIEPGTLPKLQSLHLIYKHLDGLSANQIKDLEALKEVALHPEVKPETEVAWHEAAMAHPIKPQVLFSVASA